MYVYPPKKQKICQKNMLHQFLVHSLDPHNGHPHTQKLVCMSSFKLQNLPKVQLQVSVWSNCNEMNTLIHLYIHHYRRIKGKTSVHLAEPVIIPNIVSLWSLYTLQRGGLIFGFAAGARYRVSCSPLIKATTWSRRACLLIKFSHTSVSVIGLYSPVIVTYMYHYCHVLVFAQEE